MVPRLLRCYCTWKALPDTRELVSFLAQIYDAGDFTLLCSEANRCGERWAGGDFLSVDRVVVWSNEGKGYLYKLPTK